MLLIFMLTSLMVGVTTWGFAMAWLFFKKRRPFLDSGVIVTRRLHAAGQLIHAFRCGTAIVGGVFSIIASIALLSSCRQRDAYLEIGIILLSGPLFVAVGLNSWPWMWNFIVTKRGIIVRDKCVEGKDILLLELMNTGFSRRNYIVLHFKYMGFKSGDLLDNYSKGSVELAELVEAIKTTYPGVKCML